MELVCNQSDHKKSNKKSLKINFKSEETSKKPLIIKKTLREHKNSLFIKVNFREIQKLVYLGSKLTTIFTKENYIKVFLKDKEL